MQSVPERLVLLATDILLAATLYGLCARRRYHVCWTFTLYLGVVLATQTLVLLAPQRFYDWRFWLIKESLHGLLKLAIACELTVRTFRAFPGALATVRRVLLVVLGATYVAILTVPIQGGNTDDRTLYMTLASEVLPRIQNGTIWVFSAVALVILWYRLPVQPLHKAILVGFVPYLLIFTVGLNAVHSFGWDVSLRGWDVRLVTGYAFTLAYLAVVAYWTYAAWRPAPVAAAVPRAPTDPEAQGAVEEPKGV